MFTDDQIERFHTDGFIHGGRVMTDEQAVELRERMFAVIEGRSDQQAESVRNLNDDEENVVVQIVNIWQADSLFREHLSNPTSTALAAQLMNTDIVRVWHDQVQHKPPFKGGPTYWHQDHPYWPIIQPADLVSCWVALDDADVENGCMWMVPGSHLRGPYKDGTIGTNPETWMPAPDVNLLSDEMSIQAVPCPVKRGHAIFHHCLTWHGAKPNRTDRGRPAIAVHYMPGHTRYIKEPGKEHMVEHHIEVASGEILQGSHFPTVWENGTVLTVEGV